MKSNGTKQTLAIDILLGNISNLFNKWLTKAQSYKQYLAITDLSVDEPFYF
jgi:hypothetical protein